MEATVLSVGKSVLNGALIYAKSALAEEVALQLGVRRDQVFITNELETMQAFLMAAHDERDDHGRVVKVWVKQVRDVAYDVEDSLQEFAVRLHKQSWWRIHRTLLDRRRVAKQMKDLRANVEDVSQRNMRYNLINSSGSKATTAAEQASITSAALFGIDEAMRVAKQDKPKVDLLQLINEKDNNLRVTVVWGISADLSQTSTIRTVYENPDIQSNFSCRAWVRLMHPFNPQDFIQGLLEQFRTDFGAKVLFGTEKTVRELTEKFDRYMNENRYFIVLNELSTIEEWDRVRRCFPNNKRGSRIIVSATQIEVASLCAGKECIISELKQLSADQNIYAFQQKVSQDAELTKAESSSKKATTSTDNNSTMPTGAISDNQSKDFDGKNVIKKSFTHIRTMVTSLEESHLVGREDDKIKLIKLISNQATEKFQVISVCGMGGIGKTTLVKDIYQNQELSGMFQNCACVTVMRPFILSELLRSLVMQLDRESSEKKDVVGLMGSTKKRSLSLSMSLEDLIQELAKHIIGKRCLIFLDDVSSTAEWNMIMPIFHEMENTSRIIVTTRVENISKHWLEKQVSIYKLGGLEYKDAHKLFTKKVFKETLDLAKQYPQLVEQTELILKKCGRLPLAIVTIGGFLANQPKTSLEWKKLNDNISTELEMNPELGTIRTVLIRSYDGLPYHLKACFLYMPIFPEDYKVGRGRIARRWSAEGYSREVCGKSAEDILDGYFMELISRSMILSSQKSIFSIRGIDSCQVHDLIREIGISKSMEENLVFRLEQGCSLNSQAAVRHLAISSNWEGDQSEFNSMVDTSRVRSITVFGDWKSFFISDKMSLLRVLDLEDTTGLHDHHLKHIGKFLHLRYLSLRGCEDFFHLPNSLGNLRQLETLDIRGTSIVMLLKTIAKLWRLQNLRAGRKSVDDNVSYEEMVKGVPWVMRNKLCLLYVLSVMSCLLCCAPQIFPNSSMSCYDKSVACFFFAFPSTAMHLDLYGVLVQQGIRKLKALRTLGVVNIAQGKNIVKDIKGLTRLRKLGVTGVHKGNGPELCSAIVGLSDLESLSIRSEGMPGLHGCLDELSTSPENLQSLKLYGNLAILPEWIKGLNNLVQLKLRSTMFLNADAVMEVLGNLPNLASLHLLDKSFQQVEDQIWLNFVPEMFLNLVVLELGLRASVVFEQGATPKLELLKFYLLSIMSGAFSGLPSLPSLKKVLLQGGVEFEYLQVALEYLQAELAKNPNRPVWNRV